jgi:hypothetical protein
MLRDNALSVGLVAASEGEFWNVTSDRTKYLIAIGGKVQFFQVN